MNDLIYVIFLFLLVLLIKTVMDRREARQRKDAERSYYKRLDDARRGDW